MGSRGDGKAYLGEYVLGRGLEARRMVSDVMTVNQQQQASNELCKKGISSMHVRMYQGS